MKTKPQRQQRPSILALCGSATLGTLVYLAFVFEEWSERLPPFSSDQLLIILPTLSIAVIFEAFVVLPLWEVLGRRQPYGGAMFVGTSFLVWLLICLAIVHFMPITRATMLESLGSVILPGLVLIVAFQILASPSKKTH